MPFRYYQDPDLLADLLRYRMRPHLAAIAPFLEEIVMPPVDIKRLTANMERAHRLVGRAAMSAERGERIMDAFEQHLDSADATLTAVQAYDEQLLAMQQIMGGNGGPPLDDGGTPFQPPTPPPQSGAPAPAPAAVTSNSSFDHATGDPVR